MKAHRQGERTGKVGLTPHWLEVERRQSLSGSRIQTLDKCNKWDRFSWQQTTTLRKELCEQTSKLPSLQLAPGLLTSDVVCGFRKLPLDPLASETHRTYCKLHMQNRSFPSSLLPHLKEGRISLAWPHMTDRTEITQLPRSLGNVVFWFADTAIHKGILKGDW